jgi:hypothetical protein
MNDLLGAFASSLVCTLDPAQYIEKLWNEPLYDWQVESLDPAIRRLLLLCARQSGKSTIVAGKACHTAKYKPGSLTIIVSASEKQAKETMGKVRDFVRMDGTMAIGNHDSESEIEFTNGSRILVLAGTVKSVKGYSKPALIILDEAAYIEDATYFAIRPMLTGNPDAVVVILSTPWGKQGFFYRAWHEGTVWHKIFVRPPYTLSGDNRIVPFIKEAELRKKWRAKNVSAYYSPRHTLEHLEEELGEIGAIWWRQEYECEFVDNINAVFNTDDIDRAFNTNIKPLFSDDEEREEELPQMEFNNVSWG